MRIQPTIHKTFSYWLWLTAFGVLGLGLANLPLFNLLAFEFCAVLALGISLARTRNAHCNPSDEATT